MAKLQAFGSKKKLKAFGAKKPTQPTEPAKKSTSNGKGKLKLRKFGTDDTPLKQLEEVQQMIAKTQAEYIAAQDQEKIHFKLVDKLSLAGKTDSDRYHDAMDVWNADWQRINTLDETLHQLIGTKKIKEKAINARHR